MAYEDSLSLRERGGAHLSHGAAEPNKAVVQHILGNVKAEGRTSLTAPEGKLVCDVYGIAVPKEGLATDAREAAQIAAQMGFPVVLKFVSPEILHKTEAGDVLVGVTSEAEVEHGFATVMDNAKRYGFYYTPKNLCATFCTPYDVRGKATLSSQSGGIGMAIIGFSRSAKMGVSAIVGLGNKSDIDEDDLLTFFEQDDHTEIFAQHCEDLKDGRAFAEAAARVSKKKPVVKVEMKAKGIEKPIVASLAGDVQVEEAAEYLYEHGVPACTYSTEIPVAVLGAKYKWARGAGKI
ncbi:acetate--CoA ligase family protein [Paraburkholderia sp. 2C]